MDGEWYRIVDSEGREGTCRKSTTDPAHVEVVLGGGERLLLSQRAVRAGEGGSFQVDHPFSALLSLPHGTEHVIPVVREEAVVGKQSVVRERVRVRTTVGSREETVEVPLVKDELRVERIPVGRVVEAASGPRHQGETLIVPVYEEVLVVEKRLLLREEVHVTRVPREEIATRRVTLRSMDAAIERDSPEAPASAEETASDRAQAARR